eukprot:scaffold31450_cov54-Prasinocladus_malaysianus.AAC.1
MLKPGSHFSKRLDKWMAARCNADNVRQAGNRKSIAPSGRACPAVRSPHPAATRADVCFTYRLVPRTRTGTYSVLIS